MNQQNKLPCRFLFASNDPCYTIFLFQFQLLSLMQVQKHKNKNTMRKFVQLQITGVTQNKSYVQHISRIWRLVDSGTSNDQLKSTTAFFIASQKTELFGKKMANVYSPCFFILIFNARLEGIVFHTKFYRMVKQQYRNEKKIKNKRVASFSFRTNFVDLSQEIGGFIFFRSAHAETKEEVRGAKFKPIPQDFVLSYMFSTPF